MKDETILRMLGGTCKMLEGVSFPVTTPHLVPSYNALLAAARSNHPDDVFLSHLTPLEAGEGGPEEMRILFGQLHIVMESLQEQPTLRDR